MRNVQKISLASFCCCCMMPVNLLGQKKRIVPIFDYLSLNDRRKSNVGYFLLTFSVWFGLLLLGLHVLDYSKDTTFTKVLHHYDCYILNQNYTFAYEHYNFYVDFNLFFLSSIGLILANYVISAIYLMVSFKFTSDMIGLCDHKCVFSLRKCYSILACSYFSSDFILS